MEKKYKWSFSIGAYFLLIFVVLILIFNIGIYLFSVPIDKTPVARAVNEGTLELQILPAAESPAPAPSAGAVVGGGGGGGAATSESSVELKQRGEPFSVSPDSLSVNLFVGEQVLRSLSIQNLRNIPIAINTETKGEAVIKLDKYVALEKRETKSIDVKVGPTEKGLLTGKIIFSFGQFIKEIPVVVNAKTRNFLFDVSLDIAKKYRSIYSGGKIPIEVNLQQVGESKDKIDITIDYVIKDFSGINYLEEKETLSVQNSKSYTKEFSTKNLPTGKYIVGIEVQYPGAFATASAQFEIIEKKEIPLAYYFSIISIIAIITCIVVIMIILIKQRIYPKNLSKKKGKV